MQALRSGQATLRRWHSTRGPGAGLGDEYGGGVGGHTCTTTTWLWDGLEGARGVWSRYGIQWIWRVRRPVQQHVGLPCISVVCIRH